VSIAQQLIETNGVLTFGVFRVLNIKLINQSRGGKKLVERGR